MNALIKEIEKVTGKKAKVSYVKKQTGDVEDTWADTRKVQQILGWQAETEIAQGLKKYISWIIEEDKTTARMKVCYT